MAHGVSEVLGEGSSVKMVHQKQQQQQQSVVHQQQQNARKSVGVMGSRRIFAPAFKLKVLDSYRNDIDCRGNQRATARKYGIHRRQIQKWLQCEDNLRNSCVENVSTVAVSTTLISSAGVSKPDGTVTEATGSAVTPAAPALNLSLARLHGDELTAQQGPPPLLPHPSHGGSPSSPQYASQSTTTATPILPLRVVPVSSYQEQQHHLRREIDERVQVPEIHGYSETRGDQERTYYVLNSDGQHRELEASTTSASYVDGKSEVKVYQTLTSYRSTSRPDHRYNENEVVSSVAHRRSPNRHPAPPNYGPDAEDTAIDGKSYGLLLAPSMIKTERASPDSAATPGLCDSANSPGASRVPLSPVSHQGSSGSNTTTGSTSTTSVHFGSPRPSASLCLHVQVREHAHACPSPDSEKPECCLHQQEREPCEASVRPVGKGRGGEDALEEAELVGRAVVKEEVHLEEEEANDEGGEGGSSSCLDYQRPPALSSLGGSRPVTPTHEGYSLPCSPRGPAISERSSSSCSDSEMDPLDCSSGSQQSSNDLTRRRSFSLRFKLDVLDAFHRDVGVAGNQRATARKFGINRRQVQKWLGQETELRGEIALRGNSRQRLGPMQDAASGESPVDLRMTSYAASLSHERIEGEYERSPPPPLYCCDVGSTSSASSQHLPYYHHPVTADSSSETEPAESCGLSCCVDGHATTASTLPCYQEHSLRGPCYADSHSRMYCYSPRDYTSEVTSAPEPSDEMSSPLKRQRCTLSCCYEASPSPKRLCLEAEDVRSNSCQDSPPQDTPLCLVKPKRTFEGAQLHVEPVTSTVPTSPPSVAPPPPAPTSKKDAILFKPYLDNPVSKPAKEHVIQRELSPVSTQSIMKNNNNNCQSICNLNEGRGGHDYALELSLRVPESWRTHPSPYTEFPQVRSAFVRYPASPHYT